MKIVVTGANGLLGQKLSLLLDREENIDLVATARKPLAIKLKKGTFHLLDITSEDAVDQIFTDIRPDIVINTAAMTQVDQCESERQQCWLANVTAVEHLVHACQKVKAKLIHVSTDFIFDGTEGPLKEDAKPGPVNYYGLSKLAGEEVIRQSKIDWAIVRTVLVYGITADLSRSNIVLWVKKSLEEGKTINVVNDQWRTPTLAEDLAMGCYLVAKLGAKGIYHISGEEMMTPYDIAIETATFFNLNKSLIKPTDSTQFKQPAARPLKTGFDITKAKRELGYNPHSFTDGLSILANQIQKIESEK
ncbi:MAG TPA: NAD(P)-dependent oxidoreductase [Cytophagales bacterium]|nr:NAD(P)-dependent oxidoreductase [Cytophagales bacterium]